MNEDNPSPARGGGIPPGGVRQLMGEAGERQVNDTANALVTGIGWINYGRNWGTSAAMALVPNQ